MKRAEIHKRVIDQVFSRTGVALDQDDPLLIGVEVNQIMWDLTGDEVLRMLELQKSILDTRDKAVAKLLIDSQVSGARLIRALGKTEKSLGGYARTMSSIVVLAAVATLTLGIAIGHFLTRPSVDVSAFLALNPENPLECSKQAILMQPDGSVYCRRGWRIH